MGQNEGKMLPRLSVSSNRRFLQTESGQPFFWLADTAWELFHRCTPAEAEHYLKDRAAKGFTVIQAVFLAEIEGITVPTPGGHLPLIGQDPTQLDPGYLAQVVAIVELANSLGLRVALLPTWGDKWNKAWGAGPEIFNPTNARIFGEIMGRAFGDKGVIWVLGGDREIKSDDHREIIRAMAAGVKHGDGGRNLVTFHPQGGRSSGMDFHEEDWLDFNMWQSGHDRNRGNYACIEEDYKRTPTKPCLDGEPGYEDHASSFNLDNGYLDDYDCRKSLYWALMAGACGHTYGCHPIWQMLDEGRPAITWARRPWKEALHLPGAGQMQFGRRLLLSRPYFTRIPDQGLVKSEPRPGAKAVRACRDESGSYAFVYLPFPEAVVLDVTSLSSSVLTAWWYCPRTGVARQIGDVARGDSVEFTPPSMGPDWVLVLDDPSKGFGRPGAV